MKSTAAIPSILLAIFIHSPASAEDTPTVPVPTPVDLDPVYFGADPTGEKNSAPAFVQLMAAAGKSRHIRIRIPPAELDKYPSGLLGPVRLEGIASHDAK